MKDMLVGYTGFVGSNIVEKHNFEGLYNSLNIEEAYGKNPEMLVYAGVPSAMFLANNFPEKDMEIIKNAGNNIKKINPQTVILISTIAVYSNPVDCDENSKINADELATYGKNRLLLEQFVEENFDNHLIVRLPAIFGKNIKKNFIYDYINLIPALLSENKYEELLKKDNFLKDFYYFQNNGFYKCKSLTKDEKLKVKEYFMNIGFSALNFTDSRSVYQFYDLANLCEHIQIALKNGIKKLNLATEPISAKELYKALSGKDFDNELNKTPYNYDYKTIYFEKFNGKNGYIYSKQEVVQQIKNFVQNY